MGYYTRNGGLIGTGEIEEVTGVHDIVTSQLLSGAGSIFADLVSLAQTLGSATVPSASNLQSIQSIIENTNDAFNVFAVVGYGNYSEGLAGTGVAGGKRTHTAKGFNYNSTWNVISTNNTIVDMTGGAAASLSVIDGKKWMAMAQFNGSSFAGLLLWIFTGDQVTNTGSITQGARSVTTVRDIFYPDGVGSSNYHHIYPIAINSSGTVTSNTTSGASGWNFSNNANPGTSGYYQTGRLAQDDGQWGFRIPGYTDGNAGGSIFTTNGYGMGNYNSGDSNQSTYWNGSNTGSSTNNMGFVFSGDA